MTEPQAANLMSPMDVEAYTNGTVKAATLRWWRYENKGRGPRSFKLGRRLVYRKCDVEAWLDAQYNASPEGKASA